MSLEIRCDCCHKYITTPGGLFFSPPDEDGMTRKLHVCVSCSGEVEVFILDPYSFQWAEVEM